MELLRTMEVPVSMEVDDIEAEEDVGVIEIPRIIRVTIVPVRITVRVNVLGLFNDGLVFRRRFCSHNLPASVGLPAGRTIPLLLYASDDDRRHIFPAVLAFSILEGSDRHQSAGAVGVRIHPGGRLIGPLVLQRILEGFCHRLLLGPV